MNAFKRKLKIFLCCVSLSVNILIIKGNVAVLVDANDAEVESVDGESCRIKAINESVITIFKNDKNLLKK